MPAQWVSSSEVHCLIEAADSLVSAADTVFLPMNTHEEVLETSDIYTEGPHGHTVKNGELILTYGNEVGTAWIANLVFSLRASGIDHSLVIVMSEDGQTLEGFNVMVGGGMGRD